MSVVLKLMLGDEIMVGYGPNQDSLARVVAIGTDLAIDGIDMGFYSWAKAEGLIDKESVVIEWIDSNPLEHNNPKYSTVGNYMTLQSICCERFVRREIKEVVSLSPLVPGILPGMLNRRLRLQKWRERNTLNTNMK